MCIRIGTTTLKNRHDISSDDMRSSLTRVLQWIKLMFIFVLVSSAIGHAETKSHTRHPHTGSTHHRSIRADTRTNLSYESTSSSTTNAEYTQMYSKQNAKLMLDCAVNINFSTSIWLKDGQMVQTILKDNTNNKRVIGHRFLVDASGNLFIDNVRLDDDGRWQCEAEDAFGFVVTGKPIQLTILDAPKKAYLMIDNRILDPGNPFIPVKENANLTVSCVVDEGNPKPSLSWELTLGSLALLDAPEVPLEVLNLTETVRDQKVGARNDVKLTVLRAHHNATLTCFVHHIALDQPINVSVLLNVQYTPSFVISREPEFGFPIREGIPVSLKCDVDANPKASPIWQKDDSSPPVQQTPDGFLNFTEIRREHSGWYKCIARHRLGRFSSIRYFLNVRYDMEVTQEPDFDIGELSSTGRQLEVSLGGAVQLACPTGTTGCWARVEPGSGRLEPMGASQELRLDNVLYQEAGEYRCVAPNRDTPRRLELIRNALSIQVVVTGRPMVTPTNRNITAIYGQPLTLTMEFCANPPYDKVLWIAKDAKVYKPGDADKSVIAYGITNSSEPNCHQAVLFLTKVTSNEVGEYIFLVKSRNGTAEGNVHVNITYASGYSVQDIKSAAAATDIQQKHHFTAIYVNVIVLVLIIMINCYY